MACDLQSRESRYGIAALVALPLLLCLGACWYGGWNAVKDAPIVREWQTVRHLMSDSMSHLRHVNDYAEIERGFLAILEYAERSDRSEDFDSVKRDLVTKVDVLEIAADHIGCADCVAALETIRSHLRMLSDDDWADPRKQRGILMMVYNDISPEVQETLDMSERMRGFTLKALLERTRNSSYALTRASSALSDLRELRGSLEAAWKLISVDLLSGVLQLNLARHVQPLVAGLGLPTNTLLQLSGYVIVWSLGLNGLLVMYLVDYSYAHYMSMQEKLGMDPYGNLMEFPSLLGTAEFFVLLLTGQGLVYVPTLLCVCLGARTGRNGSGIASLVMSAFDVTTAWFERYLRTDFWLYNALIALRGAFGNLPDVFLGALMLFASTNVLSLVWWLYADPVYGYSCAHPLYVVLQGPYVWLCVGIMTALTFSDHLKRAAVGETRSLLSWLLFPSNVLVAIDLAGNLGYLAEVGRLGYMLKGENYVFALLAKAFSSCMPAQCAFLGISC